MCGPDQPVTRAFALRQKQQRGANRALSLWRALSSWTLTPSAQTRGATPGCALGVAGGAVSAVVVDDSDAEGHGRFRRVGDTAHTGPRAPADRGVRRGRGRRRRVEGVQPWPVLAQAALVGQPLHDAVQPGGVNAEPLADLADRDPGVLADEPQDVVVPLTWSRGRRTPPAGRLAAPAGALAFPGRRRCSAGVRRLGAGRRPLPGG